MCKSTIDARFIRWLEARWHRRPAEGLAVALAVLPLLVAGRSLAQDASRLGPVTADRSVPTAVDPPSALRLAGSRGSLLDRNGVPLATSDRARLEARRADLAALGIHLEEACPDPVERCYPLAGRTWHLLGDVRARVRWHSPRSRFIEKELDARLEGLAVAAHTLHRPLNNALLDLETTVATRAGEPAAGGSAGAVGERVNSGAHPEAGGGPASLEPSFNLRPRLKSAVEQVIALARHRAEAAAPPPVDRDVVLSLDARLQVALGTALERTIRRHRLERGAVVVLEAGTGEVLALVNHPWPEAIGPALARTWPRSPVFYDRARFVFKAPGSTFKLVTALAALRKDPTLEHATYRCIKLGRGRVGCRIEGLSRPIRDDEQDRHPHGEVDLRRGIQESCNAYFAQLGVYSVRSEALLETAGLFGITLARPNTPEEVDKALAQTAYGQGEVLTTPLEMAGVAATIANDGLRFPPTLLAAGANGPESVGLEVVGPEQARLLGRAMRTVVTSGTAAEALAGADLVPIAGKTGTAEVRGNRSHAWFVGFAPWWEPEAGATTERSSSESPPHGRRIAFAIVLENAGYGGVYAAPLAAELVKIAESLQIISRPSPAGARPGDG